MRLAIKTTEYSPNATHLRELATPLPLLSNEDQLKPLISTFDTQKATVESCGPTEDFVGLQLLLARAECKHDFSAAGTRLVQCYFYISEKIKDLSSKCACLSLLLGTLADIDEKRELEKKEQLHTVVSDDLSGGLEELLAVAARQHSATKNVIKAMAQVDPEMGLKVARSLNTETRRDAALMDLVTAALNRRGPDLPISFLQSMMDSFADPAVRDVCWTNWIAWNVWLMTRMS